MSEAALLPRSPLAGLLRPVGGRGAAGVTVAERGSLRIAGLVARAGGAVLADIVRAAYGVDLPTSPRRTEADGLEFIWAGPAQWIVLAEPGADDLAATLRGRFGMLAAVTEQDDARVVLRIAGPRVRDALAKGVPIDLHPRAFGPGDVALTLAGHVPVHLWQVDDGPAYDIAVARSLAGSFCHWLRDSAGEYGMAVEG
ncbi:MAG: sarcosine oxidase, gamma subunit [Acidisphaera sp.]|nr:sarcosine oxidase, gamma subunit [Acidisphaera sp.]